MKIRTLFAVVTLSAIAIAVTIALAQTQSSSQPERALIDDLVLVNRMVASEELGVLDAFGHVSARSLTNPNRFYLSRYIAPGIVRAADIIEYDLEAKPVAGDRNDQYTERFIHSEVYKSRPDVMAVVHSHTPELVAFGASSVRLLSDDEAVPVYDIRKDNNGRSGTLTSAPLARAMVQTLGKSNSVLLLGHGVVVAASSLTDLPGAVTGLIEDAQRQQQLIALGGTFDANPRRVAPNAGPANSPRPVPAPRVPVFDRAWEYRKRLMTPRITGPNSIPRQIPPAPTKEQQAINDLVLANRIFASRQYGILGTSGHVSVRNPNNPNHYFISRYISPGMVTAADIIENDLDSKPVKGPRSDEYEEIYMHGEIYKARPDVMAVLHSHTPEFVTFSNSSVPLRPVVNGGTFIGDGLPLHDIRKFDPRETIIRTPELGKTASAALGNKPALLLKGHGIALTGSSLQDLVGRAINLRANARIQQMAIALGGQVVYLDGQPPAPASGASAAPADGGYNRGWEYWKQIIPTN